jgi:hypothetical protein
MMGELGLVNEEQSEMGARVTRAIQLKAMRYAKPKKNAPAEFSRERQNPPKG